MPDPGSTLIWAMPVKHTRDRPDDWYGLDQYEREYVFKRMKLGIDIEQVRQEFRELFGKSIQRGTIKTIVAESALPQFKQVKKYKCSGCGGDTQSSPCIVCTVKKIGEIERRCNQQ